MIKFGSVLIKSMFPDFRKPNDIDWIVFNKSESRSIRHDNGSIEEFHYLPLAPRDREMNADEIYTLKVSHAIRDIHWAKTMSDIRFLQMKNCQIVPGFLFDLREFWNEFHGKNKRGSFDVKTKEDFFKDNVKRKISHDGLHCLLNSAPSYLKIVDPENGVTPLEDKFLDLTKQEKINVAFEEALVIGLERYRNYPERKAYHFAQRDLVTRLHPMWLADFVIENWNSVFWNAGNATFLFEKYCDLRKEL